jgi:hypothetical protein
MKLALFGFAALAAIAVSPVAAPDADAGSAAGVTQHHAQDFSAARKHYKHHRHYAQYYAPSWAYGRRYGWSAGDPNAGPNSLLSYYRRYNICAIDEGYGRATRCD